ncbi:uncharacterized protein LOC110976483 [Acanthaster planci]|uniref:Uncharacterized protein LOC110976483 n=1 Tax=Acanthaster planci TaxID=133434 RepID=A0A8B7XX64_ACAPL|nr:uncharacterized protein LOC110976483 [Acanthaster planci]XP_022085463.1 uncharacterized protein LOC110976483 [Acanthaster planci]
MPKLQSPSHPEIGCPLEEKLTIKSGPLTLESPLDKSLAKVAPGEFEIVILGVPAGENSLVAESSNFLFCSAAVNESSGVTPLESALHDLNVPNKVVPSHGHSHGHSILDVETLPEPISAVVLSSTSKESVVAHLETATLPPDPSGTQLPIATPQGEPSYTHLTPGPPLPEPIITQSNSTSPLAEPTLAHLSPCLPTLTGSFSTIKRTNSSVPQKNKPSRASPPKFSSLFGIHGDKVAGWAGQVPQLLIVPIVSLFLTVLRPIRYTACKIHVHVKLLIWAVGKKSEDLYFYPDAVNALIFFNNVTKISEPKPHACKLGLSKRQTSLSKRRFRLNVW